jgi:hypothetical protein
MLPAMDGTYMFSPFSPETVRQGQGPALLVQFILKELLEETGCLRKTTSIAMRPFEWAEKAGSYNKIAEHASLLPFAFADLVNEAKHFINSLHKPCSELIELLEPFIIACKDNENLLYFLLQRQKSVAVKAVLDKISPEGVEKLKAAALAKYHKRGFLLAQWMS